MRLWILFQVACIRPVTVDIITYSQPGIPLFPPSFPSSLFFYSVVVDQTTFEIFLFYIDDYWIRAMVSELYGHTLVYLLSFCWIIEWQYEFDEKGEEYPREIIDKSSLRANNWKRKAGVSRALSVGGRRGRKVKMSKTPTQYKICLQAKKVLYFADWCWKCQLND